MLRYGLDFGKERVNMMCKKGRRRRLEQLLYP